MSGLIRPLALAGDRLLPVVPALAGLLPDRGLRRGSTVAVSQAGPGQGATSLALTLVTAASAAGSWCAMVAVPDLGLVAAAAAGLDLSRVTLVPEVTPAQWAAVVGVLVDTVDVVMVNPPPHLRIGDSRRLTTRVRERSAVLVTLGPWPEGVDLRLVVEASHWHGPGAGDGRLERRQVEVMASGRGAASRPKRQVLWLPASDGGVAIGGPVPFAGADVESGAADAGLLGTVRSPAVATAG